MTVGNNPPVVVEHKSRNNNTNTVDHIYAVIWECDQLIELGIPMLTREVGVNVMNHVVFLYQHNDMAIGNAAQYLKQGVENKKGHRSVLSFSPSNLSVGRSQSLGKD
jgi:hypothetical protein